MKKTIAILSVLLCISTLFAQQKAIILVKSELAGTLFVDGEQQDVLWANSEKKIEITRPGIYNLEIHYTDSKKETAKVTVDSLKTYVVNFTKALEIGSTGPAGGFIFYDKGSYDDGWRYLEVAPYDVQGKYPYGSTSFVDGLGKGGKSDTDAIIRQFGKGQYAAYVARNFSLNGYKDWFLPNREEMYSIHSNLVSKGYGSLRERKDYWVTDYYTSYGYYDKTNSYYDSLYVRPIRRF